MKRKKGRIPGTYTAGFILSLISFLFSLPFSCFLIMLSVVEYGRADEWLFVITGAVLSVCISICSLITALILLLSGRSRRNRLLSETAEAMKRLSKGETGVRVNIYRGKDPDGIATAFNSMSEKIDSLEKMRADFMCNVSHDMKTPMTVIFGYVNNILNGSIPSDQVPEYLGRVKRETMRLSKLLEPIIYISRMDAGDLQFVCEDFDICEAARNSIIAHGEKLDEKNIDFEFETDDDSMFVKGDPEGIMRVMDSLLENALTFTPKGGKIAVSANRVNDSVTFRVYNEGDGIPEEDQPYVFDRFFKGDRTRGFEKDSFGLGLYISEKIIEAHKGRITLYSIPGESCSFSFSLPQSRPSGLKRG